jgi:hypothetical protein
MIRIDVTPLPDTRTPAHGTRFEARSGDLVCQHHTNAVTGLARLLVQNGLPDDVVAVFYDGKEGLRYPSLKWLADHVLVETTTRALHWEKFREFVPFDRENHHA